MLWLAADSLATASRASNRCKAKSLKILGILFFVTQSIKMYKLDLPVDYKEAAAIERRRNMEEQRKSRIFNAKCRTIGVSWNLA